MKKAVCAGLSPLLNLCSSGILPRSSPIYLLRYQNIYDPTRFQANDEEQIKWAKKIANFFQYELVIKGPYKWYCPPIQERSTNNKVSFQESDITISNGDLLTENTIGFLKNKLYGKNISTFPEGASCFSRFAKNGAWIDTIRPSLVLINNMINRKNFRINKIWILPDKDQIIKNKFNNNDKYLVINYTNMSQNRLKFSKYLFDKYIENDYNRATFIHPIVVELNQNEYIKWSTEIEDNINGEVVLLKKHPYDVKQYKNIFNKINHLIIPDNLSILPAELFINSTRMKYLGYYSSLLLNFSDIDRKIIVPPNITVSNVYLEEYKGLRSILSI
jgi:hypothetical protein